MTDLMRMSKLRRMFASAGEEIRSHQELLSQLDSVGGDGDHGTTMVRAIEVLVSELKEESDKSLNVRLKDAGWRVLGVDGGASSALLGIFIGGMGDVAMESESDCKQLAASFAAGLGAVQKQTKAGPGDKTMIDALVPAVLAFETAANDDQPIAWAMKMAAEAAHAGAESTKDMIARYGRAKFIGEKSRGSADAGATSIALLFEGFRSALAEHEEG